AITVFSSACSLLTTSGGVPAGARMIDQFDASKPGTVSAIGGTSGVSARRSADDTPSAFNVPSFISGNDGAAAANITAARPATLPPTPGAVPLWGICPSSVPVIVFSSSANRCCDVATPGDAYMPSPGLSFASLIKSATFLAGSDAVATNRNG